MFECMSIVYEICFDIFFNYLIEIRSKKVHCILDKTDKTDKTR